jgi:DNA-binding SARP family transcriptional activator
MAGRMWPEATDERAGISLRSALSRLDASTREAILSASAGLSLLDTVEVDLRAAQSLARRLLQPGGAPNSEDLNAEALAVLSSEVLPDWYDDWVLAEAEEWRQLRMNALEAMSMQLAALGRLPEAAAAARAAMKVEPLRESANATLVRVHLAEGNQSEALRVYDSYTKLLKDLLGLTPTAMISDLVVDLRSA